MSNPVTRTIGPRRYSIAFSALRRRRVIPCEALAPWRRRETGDSRPPIDAPSASPPVAVRVLGVFLLFAAFLFGLVAALYLGNGIYWSIERDPEPYVQGAALLIFGLPCTISAALMGFTGWCVLKTPMRVRTALIGSIAAVISGLNLLSLGPFTTIPSYLALASIVAWMTLTVALVALVSLLVLWILRILGEKSSAVPLHLKRS